MYLTEKNIISCLNKNRIDFKFDKKKKKAKQYPENMGNVITLYPVFG